MAEEKQKSKKQEKPKSVKSKYRENPIPESKKKRVQELSDLLKNKKTVLIASIKNLPASQLQEIMKKLRNKAEVKIPKKNLFFRALDSVEKEKLKKLKDHFKNSIAILFSDEDSFDLSAELLRNKSPAKAKPGQVAPEDIEVQAGPTDLIPGPAISELGALGIQVQIEKGKITIKEPKVIVKEGEKITQEAADVMNKLDIKPFSIGLVPLTAFDNESDKLYLEIKIDSEKAVEDLKNAFSRALPFAVEIGYANDETIKFMLGKAAAYEKALSNLVKEDSSKEKEESKEDAKEGKTEEKPEEDKSEEKKEEKAEDKPEEKEPEKPKEEPAESQKQEKPSEIQNQTPENKTEENKSQEEKQ